MNFLVGDEWPISVDDSDINHHGGKREDRPYLHYVGYKSLDIALNVWCFSQLIPHMPAGASVVEYFAGIGCLSVVMLNRLKPSILTCVDKNDACIRALRGNANGAAIVQGDFYKLAGTIPGDVVVMDPDTFTICKLNAWWFDALNRIFHTHEYVLWVDTAIGKLHLNAQAYSDVLGCKIETMRDYAEALSAFYGRNYGYTIVALANHTRATYMLLRSGWHSIDGWYDAPEEARTYFRRME